jgi:hypothetical protein
MALENYFKVKKPRVVDLESINPNDDAFQVALLSDEQLFPPTLEEKEDVQRMRDAAASCYQQGESEEDFIKAQKLSSQAYEAQVALDEKASEFESLRQCLRNAEAAETMELSATPPNLVRAGAWKQIKLNLAKRLEAYRVQQAQADTIRHTKRQRPVASVDLTVSRLYLYR